MDATLWSAYMSTPISCNTASILYGLDVLLPAQKEFVSLEVFYKKTWNKNLCHPSNIADPRTMSVEGKNTSSPCMFENSPSECKKKTTSKKATTGRVKGFIMTAIVSLNQKITEQPT